MVELKYYLVFFLYLKGQDSFNLKVIERNLVAEPFNLKSSKSLTLDVDFVLSIILYIFG